jgi:hypothetical protein
MEGREREESKAMISKPILLVATCCLGLLFANRDSDTEACASWRHYNVTLTTLTLIWSESGHRPGHPPLLIPEPFPDSNTAAPASSTCVPVSVPSPLLGTTSPHKRARHRACATPYPRPSQHIPDSHLNTHHEPSFSANSSFISVVSHGPPLY